MDEILDTLKKLPREYLNHLVFELIQDGKITYHEITELHIKHLGNMQQSATDKYNKLSGMVKNMWSDYKKNRDENLKEIMRFFKDNGETMLSDEEIR